MVKGMGAGKEEEQGTATYFVFQLQIPARDSADVVISRMPVQPWPSPSLPTLTLRAKPPRLVERQSQNQALTPASTVIY